MPDMKAGENYTFSDEQRRNANESISDGKREGEV
jgi:hypothetical protein